MKATRFLFLALLLLCSCKPKGTESASQAPQPPTTPAPALAAAITPTPATPAPATPLPEPAAATNKPTTEQLASTLRVRISFAGLPPADVPAALIHRDEISNKALVQGRNRFVVALLKGWKEEQLRSAQSHTVVYRNKVQYPGPSISGPTRPSE